MSERVFERANHHCGSDQDVASRPIRMIDWYQRASEGRPSPCRFTPSCSSYARDALVVHGTRRGLWLVLRRLMRCRPFGPSGFDPIPDAPRLRAEGG